VPKPPQVAIVGVVLAALALSSCDGGTVTSTRRGRSVPATAPTTLAPATPGAADVGDPLIRGAGNGGYDVTHYDLAFDATDPSGSLVATTTVDANATQALSRFDLDLTGFTVDGVTVDDRPATFVRFGRELVVTPGHDIPDHRRFTTVVRYRGVPEPVNDPTSPGDIGWLRAPSGSYVVNEPDGARGVFPSNDHPSDKAEFTIHVTAPSDETVVANGVETSAQPIGVNTVHTFETRAPMATYLLQIAIGQYRVRTATAADGLPLRSAAPANTSVDLAAVNARTAEQIAFFQQLFGPYPFADAGVLIADTPPDFALETQTMPIFPASWFASDAGPAGPDSATSHELAHQWFGDDVTIERWSDIWLNEGFATYAQWLWDDHTGAERLSKSVVEAYAELPKLRQSYGAVTSPRPADVFSPNEYEGAAVVLAALRRTIGDDAFFRVLRTWVTRYGGGNASTADFVRLTNQVAGRDLTPFFDQWLRSTTVPPFPT
jgi:aminopeptidase N